MTATPMNLVELGAAGVPLDELFDNLYAHHADHRLLHRDAHCDVPLEPYTLELLRKQSQRSFGLNALRACAHCFELAEADNLEAVLHAYGRLHASWTDLEHHLNRVTDALDSGDPGHPLNAASDSLSYLRPRLDSALCTPVNSQNRVGPRYLPPAATAWRTQYLHDAEVRLGDLRGRYLRVGVLEGLLSAGIRREALNRSRSRLQRTGQWYVADRVPPGPDSSSSQLLREIHLAYTPVVWFNGERPVALYRLPGDVATLVLLTFGGPSLHDGGPSEPGDTAELLAAAAAIFDGTDPDAPLSDAATVLAMARQVLSAEGR